MLLMPQTLALLPKDMMRSRSVFDSRPMVEAKFSALSQNSFFGEQQFGQQVRIFRKAEECEPSLAG